MNATLPNGYWQNSQGHLVPEALVEPMDQTRDELVRELFGVFERHQHALTAFKARAMDDVKAFVALAGEKYGAKLGGIKGNLHLTTFDGALQIRVAQDERIVFNENIQAAKALVDECIHAWTENSRAEIKALIEHAFQTDKQGKLNTGRIIGLTQLNIEDENWRHAMQAIKDSITVLATKEYLRFYRRDKDGKYQLVPVDLAAI